jgi:hypothetical protein
MGGGRRRVPSIGHARPSAPGRGEHRPSPRGAVARSPQGHAADPVSRRWERAGTRGRAVPERRRGHLLSGEPVVTLNERSSVGHG